MKQFSFLSTLALALLSAGSAWAGTPIGGIVSSGFTSQFETSVPTVPASVYTAVVRPDLHIIAGGEFTRLDGSTAINLTAINPAGSGFTPATPSWPVYCLALQDDGKLLVAGRFDPNGFNIRRLKPDGSEEEREFFNVRSNPNGDIYSLAIHPDGRLIAGGTFTNFNDLQRSRIAVFNPDGSPNETIGPAGGTNGTVNTVAVQADGKILAAGNFTTAAGQTRNRIARWNSDGTLDTTFNPGPGPNGNIRCFVLQPDGSIIIGGEFTMVNTSTRNRIARLSSTGSLESSATFNTGSGFNNIVQTLVLSASGTVYAGGDFTTGNGTAMNRLARLSANGTIGDPVIGDGPNDSVFGITVDNNGYLLAQGKFTTVSDRAHKGMVQILTADDSQRFSITNGNLVWHRASSAPAPAYVTFDSSVDGGITWQRLGVAGYFGNGDWELRNPVLPPKCIIRAQGRVQCGWHSGSTSLISDTVAWHPAALDTAFNPNVTVDTFTGVGAVAAQADGKTLLGGSFNTVSGQPRSKIARLTAAGTLEPTTTFNTGTGPEASADGVFTLLVQPDEKIIASGSFSTWNGQNLNRETVRLSPAGVRDSQALYNVTSHVGGAFHSSALQPDGKIIFAGGYTMIGSGQSQIGIVRVNANGTAESAATWTPVSIEGWLNCLLVQPDGKILIGGDFSHVNGQPRSNFARLMPNGTLESTATFSATGSEADQGVFALALQPDGKILVGGNFLTFNGQTRLWLARLNPDGSLEPQSSFNTSQGVNSMVQSILLQADGKILVSGYFTKFGLQPFDKLVRLLPDGTAESPATFNPGITTTDGIAIAQQADGSILPYGRFATFGGLTRSGIARLKNDPAVVSLAPTSRSAVEWRRGGTAPEVTDVTFELSINGGSSWTSLGRGTRIAGGWALTGLTLPTAGQIRARGRTHDSVSEGVVQSVAPFLMQPEITAFAGTRETGTELTDAQTAPVKWPAVKRGTAPEPEVTFTIFNSGAEALNITGITLPPGYSLAAPLTFPAAIAPQGTLAVTVRLSTAAGGTFAGNIVIQSNDTDEAAFDIPVTGNILTPEIVVRALDAEGQPEVQNGQAAAVDMGFARQGDPISVRIGITNTGSASLVISDLAATGRFTARFPGLQNPPRTVDPGASIAISVSIEGDVAGTFTGQVTLTNDDPDEGTFQFPVTAAILTPEIEVHDGDGTAPQLTDGQTAAIAFGRSIQGTPATRTFTIVSSGTLPLFITSLTVPAGYTLLNPPALPLNLAIGGSVPLQVSLDTLTVGTYAGAVSIVSDDFDEPVFNFPVTGEVFIPDPVATIPSAQVMLNRQTGLREQTIRIANDTTATVPAYNLIIRGLPDGVELNNASTRRDDGSWVVFVRQPMSPNTAQDILLEYFSPTRSSAEFTPQLSTEVVLAPPDLSVPGDTAAFRIDVVKAVPAGGLLIEFPTTPGRRYQVQYSNDGTNWQSSLPSIRAAANRTQWVDRGLPRTDSPPAAQGTRFYRVAELAP